MQKLDAHKQKPPKPKHVSLAEQDPLQAGALCPQDGSDVVVVVVVLVVVGQPSRTSHLSARQSMLGSVRQSPSNEHGMSVQESVTVTQHVWQPGSRQSHCSGATRTHCIPACGQPPWQPFAAASKWQPSVVDVVVELAVVVVLLAQPVGPHASQQLGRLPTHAIPPRGAAHSPVLLLTVHLFSAAPPGFLVRQHVAARGLPQLDRAAHRVTTRLHAGGKVPSTAAAFACVATHRT